MTHPTGQLPEIVVAAPRCYSGPPSYMLEFDDGSVLAVCGRGLIGRDPIAAAGDHVEQRIAIADDTRSLSRTHLEFGITESGLWVRDCNSTNGSQLEASGSRTALVPGWRVDVPSGCTIHMGARKVKVVPITGRGEIGGVTMDWGVASRVGPVHAHNQDAYCATPPVFVVADGMGGHRAGDIASAAAVEALSPLIGQAMVTRHMLDACLADARVRIGAIPAGDGRPPGTTLSGVIVTWIDNMPFWMVLNIGDSRTYRLDAFGFRQVSVDHSVVRELTDAGAITASVARSVPVRNLLTRALIAGSDYPPDVWLLPMVAGDRMLVCSDGLSGQLDDRYIAKVLRTASDPRSAADKLVEAAVDARSRDDVTALVIDAVAVDELRSSGSAADVLGTT